MKLKKHLAVFLSVLLICTNTSIPATAKSVSEIKTDEIAPMYAYAKGLYNTLTISENVADCKSDGYGKPDVNKISVEHTLQKLSGLSIWNNVNDASWSKTSNGQSVKLTSSKSGLESGTYRLKSVFKLTTKSGKTETNTIYSPKEIV